MSHTSVSDNSTNPPGVYYAVFVADVYARVDGVGGYIVGESAGERSASYVADAGGKHQGLWRTLVSDYKMGDMSRVG
jgi:hypothetical protein